MEGINFLVIWFGMAWGKWVPPPPPPTHFLQCTENSFRNGCSADISIWFWVVVKRRDRWAPTSPLRGFTPSNPMVECLLACLLASLCIASAQCSAVQCSSEINSFSLSPLVFIQGSWITLQQKQKQQKKDLESPISSLSLSLSHFTIFLYSMWLSLLQWQLAASQQHNSSSSSCIILNSLSLSLPTLSLWNPYPNPIEHHSDLS